MANVFPFFLIEKREFYTLIGINNLVNMPRTRSKSRGRAQTGNSSDLSDLSDGSPQDGGRRRRVKSVVKTVNSGPRTRSSSRERRPKKCTVCEDCDGDHDHNSSGEVNQDETLSANVNGSSDGEELLDYDDEPQEMSPIPVNDEFMDEGDFEADEDILQVGEDNQEDVNGGQDGDGGDQDANNNARTVSEVRTSSKYVKKRKAETAVHDKPAKTNKRNNARVVDVDQSVQTVLSNPEALAKIMKECAPVFAKAMHEVSQATGSEDTQSPLQAVERSRAGQAGESNVSAAEEINVDFRNLELRSNRNGAVAPSGVAAPSLSEATIYTRACEQMTPPDAEVPQGEAGQVSSDESMVVSADDNVEFNFAGKSAQQQQQRQQPQANRQVFDLEADTRNRARARANTVVREAENAKTLLLKPPGKESQALELNQLPLDDTERPPPQRVASNQMSEAQESVFQAMDDSKYFQAFKIDQEFSCLTARVNPEVKRRIELGQYINLQRLLPKFKVDPNDDYDKYRMVSKDGYSYFVDDKESSNKEDGLPINSIVRWDQAFRVYSAIYLAANPNKVGEIAEYTQNIHKWALTYPWQRVYNYDILFRQLVEKKPTRPWDVVHFNYFMGQFGENLNLTQAARPLPPQSTSAPQNPSGPGGPSSHFALNKRDCCFRFNKTGKCKWGDNCNWEHKCFLCGLSNHGYYNCKHRKPKGKAGGAMTNKSPN